MISSTPRNLTIVLLLVVAGLATADGKAMAQETGSAVDRVCPLIPSNPSPLTLGRKLAGVDCQKCHEQQSNANDWTLQNEFTTWRERDRHAQAFHTLLGERSKRMGLILNVERIHQDARCLACHATIPVEWMMTEQETLATLRSLVKDEKTKALVIGGVSCEACHGAYDSAGERKGWRQRHIDPSDWRLVGPDEKQTTNGFYDVRSPASRTRMCVSCHVGDPERGRLVTHEMYAAGHPPLPAFEVETFLHDMPAHWRELGLGSNTPDARADAIPRKPSSVTEEFMENTRDAYFAKLHKESRPSFERTRSLAVGVIVTWGQSARVIASLASDDDFPLRDADQSWPELAVFECAACHHDLKLDGWRARRHLLAAPGRPMIRNWSSPLFEAVCRSLSDSDAIQKERRRLETHIVQVTREQPYGDAEELLDGFTQAAQWADKKAAEIEAKPFDASMATKLLASIAEVGSEYELDYESARHLIWGFDEVLREVDPARDWKEVGHALAEAKEMFVTDLATSDLRQETTLTNSSIGSQKVWEIDLSKVLKPAARYDARASQILFGRLGQALRAQLEKP